jgi:hypothetical protein
MSNKANSSEGLGCCFLIVLILGFGAYNLFFNKPDVWTLMVCETSTNGANCVDNFFSIPAYETLESCQSAGYRYPESKVFECGLNCDSKKYGINVCERICTKNGCRE